MDREAIQERFGIIGTSLAIQHVLDRVRLVAPTDITVLISGESGVGKELIAQAIHGLSSRRHNAMVTVNCGAIPEGLIESELFGSEKGAYTGSVARRIGYFEEANQGTIFLDEIGEMPLAAQVRLLRILETGTFSRVGASSPQYTDVRVVAATNKDLGREVQAGRFREDLYYRLSTVEIKIPPLRERTTDIYPIFEKYLREFARKYDAPGKQLTPDASELLRAYHWPGNVRELRNAAEQTIVLSRTNPVPASQLRAFLRGVGTGHKPGLVLASQARPDDAPGDARERELIYRMLLEMRIELREIKELLQNGTPTFAPQEPGYAPYPATPTPSLPIPHTPPPINDWEIEDAPYEIQPEESMDLGLTNGPPPLPTMEEAERNLIREALRRFDGNRRQTARALGISERTLYRKIKEFEEE